MLRATDELVVLGVTPKQAADFSRAGVSTVSQAWFYLPVRYEDRSRLVGIADFSDGTPVQFLAQVVQSQVSIRRTRLLSVQLRDDEGRLCYVRFFHFYPSQVKQFREGRRGLFYGKAVATPFGFELHHPEVQWLAEDALPDLPLGIRAIYPTIKGLAQARWRALMEKALLAAERLLPCEDAFVEHGLLPLPDALRILHCPSEGVDESALLSPLHPARTRLIMEELCAHRLSVLQAKQRLHSQVAPVLSAGDGYVAQLKAQLPFQLTDAQIQVIAEITADMAKATPMMRLVQGDVGSGKTLVALAACLQCIASGYQAVVMAPTELLAEQHVASMARYLGDLPVKMVLLVSKLSAPEKRERLADIAAGRVQLVVGTQALFQQHVQYARLGLVVIDEQHRFGVHQRLMLQEKAEGHSVHQLIMTATPIPRTLAMSQYGELDVSVIDGLPKGRQPIDTAVISNRRRMDVVQRVGAVCRQGQQAYWVCPLIEESEKIECRNAEETAQQLRLLLPDITIDLLHGRMDAEVRKTVMSRFASGEVQLLVATTVIEVGVDVPNASLMIIENAERFGLAQLHQLRGRVGRGQQKSYCLLLYQSPLNEVAKQRLQVMRESNNGFVIAEKDLHIRGAGELLGTRQTGDIVFKIADVLRDEQMLFEAETWVQSWLAEDTAMVEGLLERWVDERVQFLQV